MTFGEAVGEMIEVGKVGGVNEIDEELRVEEIVEDDGSDGLDSNIRFVVVVVVVVAGESLICLETFSTAAFNDCAPSSRSSRGFAWL